MGDRQETNIREMITFSVGAYNAAFGRELPTYDVRHAVVDLDVPILPVVGGHDGYLPHMEWLAANAKRATLRVFEVQVTPSTGSADNARSWDVSYRPAPEVHPRSPAPPITIRLFT